MTIYLRFYKQSLDTITALLHATVYSNYRHVPVDSTEGGCTKEEPGTATSENVTVLDPEPPGTLYKTVSLPVTIDQDLAKQPPPDNAEYAPCCKDAVESFFKFGSSRSAQNQKASRPCTSILH